MQSMASTRLLGSCDCRVRSSVPGFERVAFDHQTKKKKKKKNITRFPIYSFVNLFLLIIKQTMLSRLACFFSPFTSPARASLMAAMYEIDDPSSTKNRRSVSFSSTSLVHVTCRCVSIRNWFVWSNSAITSLVWTVAKAFNSMFVCICFNSKSWSSDANTTEKSTGNVWNSLRFSRQWTNRPITCLRSIALKRRSLSTRWKRNAISPHHRLSSQQRPTGHLQAGRKQRPVTSKGANERWASSTTSRWNLPVRALATCSFY